VIISFVFDPEKRGKKNPEQQQQREHGRCLHLAALGHLAFFTEIGPPFR
jgi:hypothetical protein